MVALGFAALGCTAAFALGRRHRAGLLAVALLLAPVGHVFWLALARTDGPMIALWLAGCAVVLPERGRQLSWRRALAGGALLVLAVLAKPTAALYGAPIVAGWLWLDRRSGLRLATVTLAAGGASLAALQLATRGGFWRCLSLQLVHPSIEGQPSRLLLGWLLRHGPVLALGLCALLLLLRQRQVAFDGALLLWLAGPLTLPVLASSGAMFAYLLPWACGQAVLVARWLGRAGDGSVLAGAAVACAVSFSQTFPLPTPEDARTAATFYEFVRERGAPILATGPDLASFIVGQPLEIEASSFPPYVAHRLPGVQGVLDRVREGRYRLLIGKPAAGRIVAPRYQEVGSCDLGYFLGRIHYTLLVPVGSGAGFARAGGDRCAVVEAAR